MLLACRFVGDKLLLRGFVLDTEIETKENWGASRARSRCRVAPPLIHFTPDSIAYSVRLFLKRQCDRTLGVSLISGSICLSLAVRKAFGCL